MTFQELVSKYWWIFLAAVIVGYVAVKVSAANAAPTTGTPTTTSTGTDATAALSSLNDAILAQTQALADLENQNALALATGLQSGFSGLTTELLSLASGVAGGFNALTPPTVTSVLTALVPSVSEQQAIQDAGAADVAAGGHAQKTFETAGQLGVICQVAAALPQVFSNASDWQSYCKSYVAAKGS